MFGILCAENGIRWLVKVGDGAAFAHELRVVANRKILTSAEPARVLKGGNYQRFRGSRQYCTAQDDDVVRFFLLQGSANFADNALDVSQIELAAALAGRAYADERYIGLSDCNR